MPVSNYHRWYNSNGHDVSQAHSALGSVRSHQLLGFVKEYSLQDANNTLCGFTVPFLRTSKRLIACPKRLFEGS